MAGVILVAVPFCVFLPLTMFLVKRADDAAFDAGYDQGRRHERVLRRMERAGSPAYLYGAEDDCLRPGQCLGEDRVLIFDPTRVPAQDRIVAIRAIPAAKEHP